MVINIADQCGWYNWQVGFSNAFVQATLKEEFYVEIPAMFSNKNKNSEETVVIKLSKSLYRLVQATCTWYQHLQKGIKSLDFDPPNLEKEMYYGRGMIVITYANDCFLFGPEINYIQNMIKEIEENGYDLTRKYWEKDKVFSFLGVNIKPEKE